MSIVYSKMGGCYTKPRVKHSVTMDCKKTDFTQLAKKAEDNMLRVLDENPHLKKWFMEYDAEQYVFNPHPKLMELSRLVESDGHSGASFGLTCHSVRRILLRN